ncbi:MAG: cobalt-precorrin 5A hydrolase [Ezakiella sp.]|nr:cobalt-precorrin 5A hydrolase [Ezakiella sp.]MDD7471447.1 cobalt-precorrin 5A hydrolase [Bacillota bacterium]
MSKTAVITFTEGGEKLYKKLRINADFFSNKKLDGGVKRMMPKIMRDYDNVIFICACGIAVRMIKDYLVSKEKDPAVVVMDETARFAISLVSGHLGGANFLANALAKKAGAIPVITTASDSYGMTAIDMFAKKHSLVIEDLKTIAPVMTKMVEKKKVFILNDTENNFDYAFKTGDLKEAEAALFITHRNIKTNLPATYLRPKNLYVGVGAKTGVSEEKVEKALVTAFKMLNFSTKSIKKLVSIDIKKEEPGIVMLAKKLEVPFETFSAEELNEVKGEFKESEFVKKTTGCGAVSARAAAKFGKLELEKLAMDGVTISVARRDRC